MESKGGTSEDCRKFRVMRWVGLGDEINDEISGETQRIAGSLE